MLFLPTRRLFTFALTISALLFLCSCDSNTRKERHFTSGQHYFEQGKYREAVIEFANAIKIDPGYAEAHHQLAQTYLKLQQAPGAARELARTIELQPDNYQARIDLANLLMLGHDFQHAKEQVDILLRTRPGDPSVRLVVSSLLAGQENWSGAMEEVNKAVALAPGRWELYLQLGVLQFKNNQPDAAEASLSKVIELNPGAIQPRVMLGNYYLSRRRFGDAEQQFHKAMELNSRSPEPRAALAHLYLAEGKKAEAEDLLKHAKAEFPDDSAGYRLLGDFYFTTGEIDKALAEYATLYQQHPEDLQVKKNYVQLLIQTKRFPEARRLDDELLKANPNDEDALVYQSQMQITDGDVNDAAPNLETVIKNAPKNSEAHYALGVAYEKLGYLERAVSEWREALRLQPNMLDAERSLANVAMRTGDMGTLEEAATQLIALQSASPEGYALRALSNINRRRYGEAEQDIRKAIAIAPKSAFGYAQLGNLKFVEKQYGDALRAYQDALDRNPDSTDALRGVMNTLVAQKQADAAIVAANAQIAKSPNNSSFYDLLGTTLFFSKKDFSAADAAFQKSAAIDPHNTDALFKLCQVRVAKGEADQAIATAQQALKDNPREANLYVLLGKLYESKSDWKQAEDADQSALAISPQHPQASNNLAKLLVQTGGNLDVALSLAQTARTALPDSPAFADTLAWINYQKGAYQSAIGLLQEALKLQEKNKAPDNPDIHYHLGMAYAKIGQNALAREQLERALKINPNASEAKKQLAQLKSS